MDLQQAEVSSAPRDSLLHVPLVISTVLLSHQLQEPDVLGCDSEKTIQHGNMAWSLLGRAEGMGDISIYTMPTKAS